jgi:tRNA threonylcarbamoyl adenosine modification protein (Sua5/YciO/YrdC/YwlC family)
MLRLGSSPADIAQAAEILKNGGLAAFPTETVYGLGADAFNARALARVFEVKGRPRFDPLIIHIAAMDALERIVRLDSLSPQNRELLEKLVSSFWPGPLTVVLPRRDELPGLAAAGLPTAAVRFPSHPLARQLIALSTGAIAAPSANPFGRLSPTRAEHVIEGLGETIDCIVDGGPCPVGVESTVLELVPLPRLLRPGGISREQLEAVIGPIAPGDLTCDRDKPAGVDLTCDRDKPAGVGLTCDRNKPADVDLMCDRNKPADVDLMCDRNKPAGVGLTCDRNKPADVGLMRDRNKPAGVDLTCDRNKPAKEGAVPSPGMLASHYAPEIPLFLHNPEEMAALPYQEDEGYLFFSGKNRDTWLDRTSVHQPGGGITDNSPKTILALSEPGNSTEAAANLFEYLHRLDSSGVRRIHAETVPEEGLGAAVNDRLRRAGAAGAVETLAGLLDKEGSK